MIRPLLLLTFACAIALTARTASAQEYTVIVHPSNSVVRVPTAEIAQLFLKKRTKWPSGVTVVPVDQSSGNTRTAFSQEVLGRDVAAIRAYWQQQIFSGRSTAPDEKASDAAVLAFVRETPGAIGYISSSTPATGVKVLVSR